ncbi:MAG: peroxiredoxin family protein [Syntrophobacteraceae bacterium]
MNCFKSGTMFGALFFSFILLITVLIGLPAVADEQKETAPAVATPDFQLQDLNGTTVTLSQFKGQKPVLLYFWATWCHFCLAARPAVIELRKSVPDADLEIFAINVGSGDSLEKVKRFEDANPAPYTVLYDADTKVTRSYRVEGIPHFVLLDKNGKVKYEGNRLPSDPMNLLK